MCIMIIFHTLLQRYYVSKVGKIKAPQNQIKSKSSTRFTKIKSNQGLLQKSPKSIKIKSLGLWIFSKSNQIKSRKIRKSIKIISNYTFCYPYHIFAQILLQVSFILNYDFWTYIYVFSLSCLLFILDFSEENLAILDNLGNFYD